MGGGAHPPIPDYKIYKVEGIPELETLQRRLAAHGLKDPWIRNEAWRYMGPGHTSPSKAAYKSLTRGFKFGFAAFVISVAAEAVYNMSNPKSAGHGHH